MTLETGQEAPDFSLRDQHGQEVSLSSFRGEKAVVVMFYPYAFSRVCTGELCAVRDELSTFENDAVAVLSISVDSVFSHRIFAEQEKLTFPLLSDFWPHGEVAQAYGVFDENLGAAVRGTFIVDKDGIVRWSVVNAIPDARSNEDYKAALAALS